MVRSTASTIDAYLAALPADRRAALAAVRDVINNNLPGGFQEGMLYGMPGWYVPLARYPDTYNGQPLGLVSLASQKGYMAIYLNAVYADPAVEAWFRAAWAATGKKLDMGKSCVRFKTLDALPLALIGEVIAKVSVEDLLAQYEAVKSQSRRPSARTVRSAKQKPAATKKQPRRRRR